MLRQRYYLIPSSQSLAFTLHDTYTESAQRMVKPRRASAGEFCRAASVPHAVGFKQTLDIIATYGIPYVSFSEIAETFQVFLLAPVAWSGMLHTTEPA